MLDPSSLDKILTVLEGWKQGKWQQMFVSNEGKIKIDLPKLVRDRVVEVVPISEGCLGSCTFCCTRLARGRLFSYPLKSIVQRVTDIVDSGVKEIWLTAQDTGAYGLDSGCNIVTLLEQVCDIRGQFWIRVGMMNPNNVLGLVDELIKVFQNDKMFKFIHLPVQSGNDDTLKCMHRRYSVQEFRSMIASFRREIPDMSLSTDIICGFPGEDGNAFTDSLKLIQEIEPDIVNISKFSSRPHTVAAEMRPLPSQIVKARSKRMTELCKQISLKRNKHWLNWTGQAFIDEIGTRSHVIGRNLAYKPILVKGSSKLLGQLVTVQIKQVTPTYLMGESTT